MMSLNMIDYTDYLIPNIEVKEEKILTDFPIINQYIRWAYNRVIDIMLYGKTIIVSKPSKLTRSETLKELEFQLDRPDQFIDYLGEMSESN